MQASKAGRAPVGGGAKAATTTTAPSAGAKAMKAGLRGASFSEGEARLSPDALPLGAAAPDAGATTSRAPQFPRHFDASGRCDFAEAWSADPQAKVTGVILDVDGLGFDPSFGGASFGEARWDPAQVGRKMIFAGTYIGDVEATDDLGQAGANPLWVRAKAIEHNYRYMKDPQTGKQRVIDDDQKVFLLASQNNLIVEADAWRGSGFLGGKSVIAYTGEDAQEGLRPTVVQEQQDRHFKSKSQ